MGPGDLVELGQAALCPGHTRPSGARSTGLSRTCTCRPTPLLSLSGSVVVLGRECHAQRGAVTILGSAMSKRTQVTKLGLGSRPSSSEGSVPAHVALPSSRRHLLGASSLLNVQSPSSLPHRGSAHLWVFRTSVPPPPGPASSRLPSSVSPSTLWPPLPRLPGIPLLGSCRPGLPPLPAPGLC